MANYQQLKNALVDVIKQNGNNEITGEIMQTTLLSMINSLGANYQFAGILTPSTSFVAPDENIFFIGGGGTYNNFGSSEIIVPSGSIGIFMYNGSYTYSVLQSDGVFDISVYRATGVTPAQYADLAAALGTNGVNVPEDIRKGGMSVKFIQSTDNNYVQYMCISQAFSTNLAYWEKINLQVELLGKKYIDSSYIGDSNQPFTFSEVNSDTDAILNITGTLSAINYCIFSHDSTNISVIDNYSNAKVTIPATANKLTIYPRSGQSLNIDISLKTKGIDYSVDVLETKTESLENENADIDNRLTDVEEAVFDNKTIGADLSDQTISNSTTNTAYIWCIKKPSFFGTVKKINFKAKAGTINFYKVNAPNIALSQQVTKTLIASVTNTSNEEGTIKTIDVDVQFGVNDYLAVNGAFYYKAGVSLDDYNTFIEDVSDDTITNIDGAMIVGCNVVVESSQALMRKTNNLVIVDAQGNGDYLNPFDAMVALLGKDTPSNPYTIMVTPGTYNMPTLSRNNFATYCTNRYLSIVGTDKQNCILRNDKGYYNPSTSDPNNLGDNAPLKISGNIYIANLTIISTDNDNVSEAAAEYHQSYCIHMDAPAPEGSIMEVHNCRLVNNHAPCIGFGIPKNVTLKITDCELESDFYDPTVMYGGAIMYGHDRGGSTSSVEEHLVIRYCVFKSSNGHAVKFINNNNALADCVFVGNACALPQGKGVVLGTTTTVVPPSFGNNIDDMNA